MTAIETLIAGLFDYAGLYPPAGLNLAQAWNNYLGYARGPHRASLGRFIIAAKSLEELRVQASEELGGIRISVVLSSAADVDLVSDARRRGIGIETAEVKCQPDEIGEIAARIPREWPAYFEVAPGPQMKSSLQSIRNAGGHAKIRMGGIQPEAIPAVSDVVAMLSALRESGLSFKATAGLHHPVRSLRLLTYEPSSPKGTMHGFMNLVCAAAAVYFDEADPGSILNEEDAAAFRVRPESVGWHTFEWSRDRLARLRGEFLISIGSCSFTEPIEDLESLGWR